MLYEVRKCRSDEFVPKAAISLLLADMLCELGTQGKNRRRKVLIDPLVVRNNTNHGAYRVRTDIYLFEGENCRSFVYGSTRY
jgi:hypothetical protein